MSYICASSYPIHCPSSFVRGEDIPFVEVDKPDALHHTFTQDEDGERRIFLIVNELGTDWRRDPILEVPFVWYDEFGPIIVGLPEPHHGVSIDATKLSPMDLYMTMIVFLEYIFIILNPK